MLDSVVHPQFLMDGARLEYYKNMAHFSFNPQK